VLETGSAGPLREVRVAEVWRLLKIWEILDWVTVNWDQPDGEQALAVTDYDGELQQTVDVDEPGVVEGAHQLPAAVHLQLATPAAP
jgi:hypothetical protein